MSNSSEARWYVYILRCVDDTLYTGVAVDVDRRVYEHNVGDRGAKYTRSRRPVSLFYREGPKTKSEALRRELEIKRMSRSEKENLRCPFSSE